MSKASITEKKEARLVGKRNSNRETTRDTNDAINLVRICIRRISSITYSNALKTFPPYIGLAVRPKTIGQTFRVFPLLFSTG